jgi:hypothetical protein
MIANLHVGKRFAWVLSLLVAAGCSQGSQTKSRSPTEQRMVAIGKAYRKAVARLGHAPKDFQELQPSLEGNVTEDFLRSPHDGEKMVVIWGVNFDRLPPGRPDPFVVAVYEQKGVDGKRYVLRFPPLRTDLMNEEQWKKAIFPPDYPHPP